MKKNEFNSKFNFIDKELSGLQGKLIQGAQKVGYLRNAFNSSHNSWVYFLENIPKDVDTTAILSSTPTLLEAIGNEIHECNSKLEESLISFNGIMATSDIFFSSTGQVTALSGVSISCPTVDSPIFEYEQNSDYAEKFSKFSPELGKTFKEIDEILYTTESDPERGSLYMARQVFDHFFEILAPDDKVRTSPYWRKKEPHEHQNSNTVFRTERIKYAAFTHIQDKVRANTMAEQAKQMIDTYSLLNEAHKRGKIDTQKAKITIISLKKILLEWADVLDF